MNRASQTMRIDISPDLKEELRNADKQRGVLPLPAPLPDFTPAAPSQSALGGPEFQELFQNVYDGAVITDLTGRIVDANTRALVFFQFPKAALLTLNLTDIISGADAGTINTLQSGIEEDRFILIQAYCVRKDKALFPVEIAVNRLKIRDQQYLCCFVRDISWRRQAEEMLKTIHKAIQNAATGIAIADLNGRIDYINQAGAHLFGEEKAATITDRNLNDLIPNHESVSDMLAAVRKGESWNGELVLLSRTTNASVHVQLAAAPNRDTDEQLIGMVLSFLDISDRIRAKEAELKADRQKVMVESLGAACHHLGQPATVLLASLELMGRVRQSDKAMGEELLASSIEAAESIRTMLHSLNDITEYKTTSYIENQGGLGASQSRILDVNTPNEGIGLR